MKKYLLLLLCLLINYSYISSSPALSIMNNESEEIKQTIHELMKKDHISGVALILVNHGRKSFYVFGNTLPPHPTPITLNTPFEIGSLTKLMTTLVLSEEILNGKANLSDPLIKHMPELSKNRNLNNINLEELATHCSGFPSFLPSSIKTKQELLHYLLNYKFNTSHQSEWQYSNIGIGLLGDYLVNQNQRSIYRIFQENIFSPLKMKRTKMISRPYPILFPAAYALTSTISDMGHFLEAAIGLPASPKNIVNAIQFSQIPRIQAGNMEQALAWQVYNSKNKSELVDASTYQNLLTPLPEKPLPATQQQYDPTKLMDKTGATANFRSYIAVLPRQQSGVVMLLNKHISQTDLVYTSRKILFLIARNS